MLFSSLLHAVEANPNMTRFFTDKFAVCLTHRELSSSSAKLSYWFPSLFLMSISSLGDQNSDSSQLEIYSRGAWA